VCSTLAPPQTVKEVASWTFDSPSDANQVRAANLPMLPNQSVTVVSNAAISPGPSTQSWSPRTSQPDD
jgi:hypothetical protein